MLSRVFPRKMALSAEKSVVRAGAISIDRSEFDGYRSPLATPRWEVVQGDRYEGSRKR